MAPPVHICASSSPGDVAAGDEITVVHRPAHDVSIAMMFRAMTTEKSRLPQLAVAGDALPEAMRRILLPDVSQEEPALT